MASDPGDAVILLRRIKIGDPVAISDF